jgi:hypothetical protein
VAGEFLGVAVATAVGPEATLAATAVAAIYFAVELKATQNALYATASACRAFQASNCLDAGEDASATSCLYENRWIQRQSNLALCGACASSSWQFVPAGAGTFAATETGCANGHGTAVLDGTTVVVDIQFGGGSGAYVFPLNSCAGGPGSFTFTSGGCTGTVLPTVFTQAPH